MTGVYEGSSIRVNPWFPWHVLLEAARDRRRVVLATCRTGVLCHAPVPPAHRRPGQPNRKGGPKARVLLDPLEVDGVVVGRGGMVSVHCDEIMGFVE